MKLHLQIINDELARRGYRAVLTKVDGRFYFAAGEAKHWLDCGVKARKINDLTLKEWVEEFLRLKEVNEQILSTAKSRPAQKP